jgi:molybdate transport system ATP-binding protein
MTAALHTGLRVRLSSQRPVPLQAEFDCAPGELVALVGASGSGKTTLLRAIAGLHHSGDLHGRIALGQEVWFDAAEHIRRNTQSRRVGLVFQHYALFPHLNALKNIALCADSMPTDGHKAFQNADQQALHWLQRFGLQELAQRKPHELSGGQQQRVALARALVRITGQERGVLLLDEPFSAVDAPMRQVLYRELAQLRQSLQVPIVLVTHDLHEARRLADRIVIIDAGQTLQSGPPAQVMRSPRNAGVAQLVGIYNHFKSQFVKAAPGRAVLQWGDLKLQVVDKNKIESNTAVTWVLAGEAVRLLANRDSTATQSEDNILQAQLTELLPLGEISLCRMAVQGTSDSIQLNLPTAQLTQLGLQTGDALQLALPVDGVHIMPLRV